MAEALYQRDLTKAAANQIKKEPISFSGYGFLLYLICRIFSPGGNKPYGDSGDVFIFCRRGSKQWYVYNIPDMPGRLRRHRSGWRAVPIDNL